MNISMSRKPSIGASKRHNPGILAQSCGVYGPLNPMGMVTQTQTPGTYRRSGLLLASEAYRRGLLRTRG